MTDLIKENIYLILMCASTFLCGIGIGATINECINNWTPKEEDREHGKKKIL